ncbi:MAG: carbohydrate porin, partial [Rickettsiales bacterium]|nr:carbohydrate porin [Rickettsiales bacterium]
HLYGNTRFQFDGGAMLIGEAGYTPKAEGLEGKPNILAVGGWMYTKEADDQLAVDSNGTPLKHHSWGAYLLSSYLFYHDKEGRGLNAFFRPSIADENTMQVEYAYEVGMQAQGWVPTRPDGEIGVGLSQAINGDTYRDSVAGTTGSKHSEYAFEVFYRDKVMPGLALQPDFQFIANPGTAPGVKNAALLGLRADLLF